MNQPKEFHEVVREDTAYDVRSRQLAALALETARNIKPEETVLSTLDQG
jgi:hypothetical protein